DRDVAEEYFDEVIRDTVEFGELVDDILHEILARFDHLPEGQITRKSGGWPESWRCECSRDGRDDFIRRMRWFSSNYAPRFGQLVPPLVNGIRVRGPFKPRATTERFDMVILDGQGLGHTPDATASVSTNLTKRYGTVNAILLVDNAMQPML